VALIAVGRGGGGGGGRGGGGRGGGVVVGEVPKMLTASSGTFESRLDDVLIPVFALVRLLIASCFSMAFKMSVSASLSRGLTSLALRISSRLTILAPCNCEPILETEECLERELLVVGDAG